MPGGDILFARLAYNLLESGDVEEATKILEKGLRAYPSYAQAHYILAKCYMKQHLTDEARAELERVLRYDPNHGNAIKDLSSMYFLNGFQDLYKEYLLKLFTLNPLNEEIVDEVKKLGEYKLWAPVTESTPLADLANTNLKEKNIPEPEEGAVVAPEIPEQVESKDYPEPIFSAKVDLSQFDNVHDDFTTILHGNLELPQKSVIIEDEDLDLLKSKEEIFGGEEEPVEITESAPEESLESMNDILGEDEELVIQQIKDTDDHLLISDDEDNMLPGDILNTPTKEEEANEGISKKPEISQTRVEEDQVDIDNILMEKSDSMGLKKERLAESDHPVADFDHLQDDEESKFEQPKIISQTLGEILVSQKKYSEAKSVFEALKEKTPNNKSLDVKIAYLDKIIGLEKKT